MMKSLFLWPFLVLLDLGFTALAMLLAPLIALFVRSDGCLPRWLWWFQTPDSRMDGCNGDANFCVTHRPCWWTYVLWQWRNPCAGFSHWLGLVFDRPVIRQWGTAGEISRLPVFRPGWHFLWVVDARGRRAFEFAATWPSLFGRCWNIRIGYKLGNLYRDPTERIPIVHRCNPVSKRGPLPDSPAKAGFLCPEEIQSDALGRVAMQENDKYFVWLLLLGACIGLGKLLVSSEALTVRLCFGRAILGSATTAIAGVALIQIPHIDPLALMAIGSALGIVGAQFVELWLKKQVNKINGG